VAFVADKVALQQVFSRVFLSPLPIFIPPSASQSPSYGAGAIRKIVAALPIGLAQSHPTKNDKNEKTVIMPVSTPVSARTCSGGDISVLYSGDPRFVSPAGTPRCRRITLQ
jgi:hypothetical protein